MPKIPETEVKGYPPPSAPSSRVDNPLKSHPARVPAGMRRFRVIFKDGAQEVVLAITEQQARMLARGRRRIQQPGVGGNEPIDNVVNVG